MEQTARREKTARMVNRERPVCPARMERMAQTASRRTSATMVTGISARPTLGSRRAEQLARRVMQVQPALLVLLGLPVRPAKMARMEKPGRKAQKATPERRVLPVTRQLKAQITGQQQTSRRS